MSNCNNCEFKCLCNSENNCIGWSGRSPLKKVCDASYQQGKEDATNNLRKELRQFVSWLGMFYSKNDYILVQGMRSRGCTEYEVGFAEDDKKELFNIVDKYLEDKENGNENKV